MENASIKEVNVRKKKVDGVITVSVIILIICLVFLYMGLLRPMLEDTFIAGTVSAVKDDIYTFNALGSLYVAFFGGLFFVFFPMEAYYAKALASNNLLLLYVLFILGILVSYSLDYLFGMKLSKMSRKLVSPKKFYKIKSYINRYGKVAIFVASAMPFFPSQQVTFILGVFRYNKTRLFILTMSGQMLKYAGIAVLYTAFWGGLAQ